MLNAAGSTPAILRPGRARESPRIPALTTAHRNGAPEAVAEEHGSTGATVGPPHVEQASKLGVHAEQWEERCRNAQSRSCPSSAIAGKHHPQIGQAGDALQPGAPAGDVVELGDDSQCRLPVFPTAHTRATLDGSRYGSGAQQHCIDHHEHRGRGADAKCERQNSRGRKARRAAEARSAYRRSAPESSTRWWGATRRTSTIARPEARPGTRRCPRRPALRLPDLLQFAAVASRNCLREQRREHPGIDGSHAVDPSRCPSRGPAPEQPPRACLTHDALRAAHLRDRDVATERVNPGESSPFIVLDGVGRSSDWLVD